MSIQVKLIVKRRKFTEEFKKKLVALFETGRHSVSQLSILYSVKSTVIYRWIYRYSIYNKQGCRIIEMSQSSTDKIKALEKKVKELERLVGQKQIKIEFLEEMIDVAKEELGVDIKKKSSTPPSSNSGKNGQ